MHTPVPFQIPTNIPEPPGTMSHAGREDVLWNRPVFKAPPLKLRPMIFDTTFLAEELRRVGFGER